MNSDHPVWFTPAPVLSPVGVMPGPGTPEYYYAFYQREVEKVEELETHVAALRGKSAEDDARIREMGTVNASLRNQLSTARYRREETEKKRRGAERRAKAAEDKLKSDCITVRVHADTTDLQSLLSDEIIKAEGTGKNYAQLSRNYEGALDRCEELRQQFETADTDRRNSAKAYAELKEKLEIANRNAYEFADNLAGRRLQKGEMVIVMAVDNYRSRYVLHGPTQGEALNAVVTMLRDCHVG